MHQRTDLFTARKEIGSLVEEFLKKPTKLNFMAIKEYKRKVNVSYNRLITNSERLQAITTENNHYEQCDSGKTYEPLWKDAKYASLPKLAESGKKAMVQKVQVEEVVVG